MKVLFMGQSSPLTMIPLKAVAKHHEIAGIAESTSVRYKPAVELIKRIVDGRKAYVSLRYFARKKAIPYYAQSDASQIGLANFVQSINPDIICVAGFSRLLKKDVFSVPLHGAINFHPALLPNYRGPQPLFWHYYFMEPQIGATIHYLDEGEDTGDIIKQKSMPIPPRHARGFAGRKADHSGRRSDGGSAQRYRTGNRRKNSPETSSVSLQGAAHQKKRTMGAMGLAA